MTSLRRLTDRCETNAWAVEPKGDPLGLYLRSLKTIRTTLAADVLVLPGHQLPFYGLHTRIDELIEHHKRRCAAIAEACRNAPRSAAEIVPVVFHLPLDPHQMGFAFSEVLAHVNFMFGQGELAWAEPRNGVRRMIAP